MALMEDERLILRWLSQYGPLRWAANSRIALLQTAALCQQACAEHEACPQDCRYRRW